MHLLSDLVGFLKENGKAPNDVRFVKHERGCCSFEELTDVIKDFNGNYVMYHYPLFIVVGDTWSAEFYTNYTDESYSCWQYHENPAKGESVRPLLCDVCTYQPYLNTVPPPPPQPSG